MFKKDFVIQLSIYFVIIFNLVFPKGGIKVNDIPITIGLVSLIFLLLAGGISSVIKFRFLKIKHDRLKILLSWIPFQIWTIIVINENGFESLGMVLSLFTNFLLIPWLMIYLNGENFDKNVKIERLLKIIKIGIWILIIYGLINHVCKIITDSYIEIPFLTVNFDDVGNVYNKNNGRGVFGKLISTYQNGNLFGASMLLLLPLFCYIDKNKLHQLLFKFTLFLTLSRTIWLGLLFYEIISIFSGKIYIKKVFNFCIILSCFVLGIIYAMNLLELDMDFIVDSSMGGRIGQSSDFIYGFFPSTPFNTISEIVYKGILDSFGVIGLVCFCIGFFSPLFIYYKELNNNSLRNSLLLGLLVYYFVCLGDGGIILIPVMIFYWTVILILSSRISLYKL